MTTPNAYDCPGIYFDLGINLARLGIVMLDVHPIHGITSAIEAAGCTPYVDPDPDSHVDGAVGERTAHLTLLHGLLGRDANLARKVLADWAPEPLTIDHIEVFPFDGFACIVARVLINENLLEAHNRLSLLPHIDLFPDYKPHITLAYARGTDAQIVDLAHRFDHLVGLTLLPKRINYGG